MMLGALLLTLTASCASSAPNGVREGKSGELAEHAYATGCYNAYLRICSKAGSDELRGACREEGMETCEKEAQGFRDWIKGGKR